MALFDEGITFLYFQLAKILRSIEAKYPTGHGYLSGSTQYIPLNKMATLTCVQLFFQLLRFTGLQSSMLEASQPFLDTMNTFLTKHFQLKTAFTANNHLENGAEIPPRYLLNSKPLFQNHFFQFFHQTHTFSNLFDFCLSHLLIHIIFSFSSSFFASQKVNRVFPSSVLTVKIHNGLF